jgi:hypothetical protein
MASYGAAGAAAAAAAAAAAVEGPFSNLILDNVYNVIALVDSRHDFKGFSQDYPFKPRGENAEYNFLKNFSANIQRKVLGFGPDYSRKYTSKCKGSDVLGIGPEKEFLYKVIEIFKPDISQIDFGGDINAYHTSIYDVLKTRIDPINFGGKKVIPIIVDTSRTLTHVNSGNYFAVCRNRECWADPSKTTTFTFPLVFYEKEGNPERTYNINNITYKIYGNFNRPSIDYTLDGDKFTYRFDGLGNHKPNEIEICKSDIRNNRKSQRETL